MYAFECFPEQFSFGEPVCTGSSEVNSSVELKGERGLVKGALIVADCGMVWSEMVIMPHCPFVV